MGEAQDENGFEREMERHIWPSGKLGEICLSQS